MDEDQLSKAIIGAAIEVHRSLGPGLLESAYEACLAHELVQRSMMIDRQHAVGLNYKGIAIDCGFRIHLFVNRLVIVEIKAIDHFAPSTKRRLSLISSSLAANWVCCSTSMLSACVTASGALSSAYKFKMPSPLAFPLRSLRPLRLML